jgi:YHS domain-containing protein
MESVVSVLLFVGFLYLMMRYGCGAHMYGGGCGHSSHRHNKSESSTGQKVSGPNEMARDPVCGMEIETARALHSAQYGSNTFYFCSNDCYRKFRERPEGFAEIGMEKRRIA